MIQEELAPLIHAAIVAAQQAGDLPPFDVPPATPIALQLAGQARRKPRPMAEAIVAHLPVGPAHVLASAEVAGPGFVNLRLAIPWLVRHVDRVLAGGEHYADPCVRPHTPRSGYVVTVLTDHGGRRQERLAGH